MYLEMIQKANHLKDEKSPYLLQHKFNPVDWYPWGNKAFQKAKEEDKPIFLSIGYSTCHWCHVMAHQSFEDQEIGKLMNEVFIPIKVDREERPDLDSIYMTVCQMMTGSGGWPLTIIMTPKKKPFFAGTYFPRESHLGGVGLKDLILNVRDLWKNSRAEVTKSAQDISQALRKVSAPTPKGELNPSILDKTYRALKNSYDGEYGGFGDFQKFPSPHNLVFLLRFWKRSNKESALSMVNKTLDFMRRGGIYDQVGFGFHRYSVDHKWFAPHFEKMLYDQALISLAYLEAYQATRKEEYQETAEEIFQYVMRNMKSEEGGFYSAEDADSEGVEGKFYLWKEEEIFEILNPEEAHLVKIVYNITIEGNFADEATGKKTGANILYLKQPLKELSQELGLKEKYLKNKLEKIRKKLFFYREKRIHPFKDDKILTDWNGLMLAALARGSLVTGNNDYQLAAEEAADFLLKEMYVDGKLLHRYREGDAGIAANLDDYAFLIWGLLELYQACFQLKYLQSAMELNQILLDHFWDDKHGGFFFTADDGEELITRKKDSFDSALPSGNSVQILNLILLARLTENTDLEERAVEMQLSFYNNIIKLPAAHTQFLLALDYKWGPSYEVVIAGERGGNDTMEMLRVLNEHYLPQKTVMLKTEGEDLTGINQISESLKDKKMLDGRAAAYICGEGTCYNPTSDVGEILDLLGFKKS